MACILVSVNSSGPTTENKKQIRALIALRSHHMKHNQACKSLVSFSLLTPDKTCKLVTLFINLARVRACPY